MLNSELVVQIVQETGRVDQVTLITSMLEGCLRMLHAKGDFSFDRHTQLVTSTDTFYNQTGPLSEWEIDTVQLGGLSTYKKLHAMLPIDLVGRPLGRKFKMVDFTTRMYEDQAGLTGAPAYVLEGSRIRLLTTTMPISRLLVTSQCMYIKTSAGATTADYGTYITDQFPELVANYVAYKIHHKNGNKEKAQSSMALYREMLPSLLLID